MQAVVQDTYGSAEVMQLRDIDKPEIGEHEVLVRVRGAGVNPADWAVMSGLPYIARPVYGLRKPKNGIRGTDVAVCVTRGLTLMRAPVGLTYRLTSCRPYVRMYAFHTRSRWNA